MGASFDPTQPHNGLLPLPPPAASLCHPRVLGSCVRAARRLGELRGALRAAPLPGVLPYMLPLVEAQASSALEGVHTRLLELLACSAATGSGGSEATRAAWRVAFVLRGHTRSTEVVPPLPTSRRLAQAVCSVLMDRDMPVRRLPGTKLSSAGGRVVYTPPEGEDRLSEMLGDWERFIHDSDDGLNPLVKLAVAHYQFEAIHPFFDGNGRTGRVLLMAQLVEQGLFDEPALCLSRWFWRRQFDYYRLLLAVTEHGRWVDWIEFVLQGIEAESLWGIGVVQKLAEAFEDTVKKVAQFCPAKHREGLSRLVFTHPCLQRADLCERLGTHPWAASQMLHGLEDAGVLVRARSGPRWHFTNVKFLALLES